MTYDDGYIACNRECFWQNIHTHYYTNNTLEAIPLREFIANNIILNKVESVLEIGCNSGGNLLYIASRDSSIDLCGLDINERALNYGKIVEHNPASLVVGSIYDLSMFQNNSFDLVFTSGVLIHVPPEKINNILFQMNRIAKRFVLNFEDNHDIEKIYWCRGSDNVPHRWEINLKKRYSDIGLNPHLQYLSSDIKIHSINSVVWVEKGDSFVIYESDSTKEYANKILLPFNKNQHTDRNRSYNIIMKLIIRKRQKIGLLDKSIQEHYDNPDKVAELKKRRQGVLRKLNDYEKALKKFGGE